MMLMDCESFGVYIKVSATRFCDALERGQPDLLL
jgi:hypothetical protein